MGLGVSHWGYYQFLGRIGTTIYVTERLMKLYDYVKCPIIDALPAEAAHRLILVVPRLSVFDQALNVLNPVIHSLR